MSSDDELGRRVHSFFHEYLTTQRNVSHHTLLSYRDTIKLFLSFASQRKSRPVVALALDDLTADLVLDFLRHLEEERGNGIPTRNARLAALHVFFRHVAAHDPLRLDQCQRRSASGARAARSESCRSGRRRRSYCTLFWMSGA